MLERLSRHIAIKIKEADPEGPGTVAVLEYELGIRLNWYLGLIMSAVFGFVIGTFIGAMVALFSFALLRKFSGGVHLSLTICSFLTGLFAAIIPLFSLSGTMMLVLNIVSLGIVLIFAPNHFEYVNPSRWDPWLKWVSAAIVLSSFLIQSSIITLAFFIQALLILPVWTKQEGGV
ncbi:accessory gene regulator B family protein [Paenibacillus taichungensis]|uniref:accessory gene regulator B family protein n=1 Tax=Paenibacillus taichungensis TaxID=484184 RepID=UPI0038058244